MKLIISSVSGEPIYEQIKTQIHLSLGRTSIILAHITFCLSLVVIKMEKRLDKLKKK